MGILFTNIQILTIIARPGNGILHRSDSPDPAVLADEVVDVAWKDAPVRGDATAPIQIVEFADFQCPYCADSEPPLMHILEQYQGQVLLAYRHFPLPMHPQGTPAAMASECAREQGKFWEMHDAIYRHQKELTADSYTEFAQQIQLNHAQFAQCMAESRYDQRIRDDMAAGTAYGVRGTPTFFINGHPLIGSVSPEQLQQKIDSLLAASRAAR